MGFNITIKSFKNYIDASGFRVFKESGNNYLEKNGKKYKLPDGTLSKENQTIYIDGVPVNTDSPESYYKVAENI